MSKSTHRLCKAQRALRCLTISEQFRTLILIFVCFVSSTQLIVIHAQQLYRPNSNFKNNINHQQNFNYRAQTSNSINGNNINNNQHFQHLTHNQHSENKLSSNYNYNDNMQTSASQNALIRDLSGPSSGKITNLDVICGKNYMTVRIEFSGPFFGTVFSKGTYGHENCIYVKQNSGYSHATFNVYYDKCGTKPDLQGKFYENTIIVQYGTDIIEAYDEAKRLRCEWFEAYEKPATFKPAIPVADLDVVEMNFQGDDIDCWMEIQDGNGPWSNEVSKIVPVGQPMTIVVAINDYNGQFDMRVKSCVAHDGVQQPIALTDEFGCVLRPKMLTPFKKIKSPGPQSRATVVSYSRFLAFKFPDSMTVQIQCTVEVCRHGCADTCQRIPSTSAKTINSELSVRSTWPSPAAPQIQHQQDNQPAASRGNFVQPQIDGASVSSSNSNQLDSSARDEELSGSDSNRLVSRAEEPTVTAPAPTSTRLRPASLPAELPHVPQYMIPNSRRPPLGSIRSLSPATFTSATATSPLTTFEPTVTTSHPSVATLSTTIQTTQPTNYPSLIGEEISSSKQSENSRTQQASSEEQGSSTLAPTLSSSEDTSESKQDRRQYVSEVNGNSDSDDQQNKDLSVTTINSEDKNSNSISNNTSNNSSSSNVDSNNNSSLSSSATINEPQNSPDSVPSVGDQMAASESAQTPTFLSVDEPASKTSQQENVAQDSFSKQSQSSLKPVEIEVPTGDDSSSIRALASGHLVSGGARDQLFSSIRLPSFNPETLSSEQVAPSTSYKYQRGSSYDDAINPREINHQMNKRDQSADADENDDALLGNVKLQFGARSQKKATASKADSPTSVQDNEDSKAMIDRSDDSSMIELSDTSPSKSGGSSLLPSVGTEELSSNDPSKLEDRIGNKAPDNNEMLSPSVRADTDKKAAERLDLANILPAVRAKLTEELAKQQSFRVESPAPIVGSQSQLTNPLIRDASQPFPNIIGQSKIMPDPTSGSLRSQQQLISNNNQASSSSPTAVIALPNSLQHPTDGNPSAQYVSASRGPQNLATSQQQQLRQQQQQQQSLPNMLQQQLAIMQKQAIEQQQTLSTSKPKSRFSLMSPHSALQAVASRLLSHNKQTVVDKQLPQVSLPKHLQYPQQLSFPQQLPEQQKQMLQALSQLQSQQQQQQQVHHQEQKSHGGLFSKLSPKNFLSSTHK